MLNSGIVRIAPFAEKRRDELRRMAQNWRDELRWVALDMKNELRRERLPL